MLGHGALLLGCRVGLMPVTAKTYYTVRPITVWRETAMFPYSAIGVFGSILLAVAVLPQLYRLLQTKSANDISLYYPLVLTIGSFCLTVYGYGIQDLIVTLLNLYATLCNCAVMLLKIYYDRKGAAKKPAAAPEIYVK